MENDLISRVEAIDVIRSMTISLGGKEIFHPEAKQSVLRALDELPAVDAEPVRHGRWELETSKYLRRCSACDKVTFYCGAGRHYDYCPNCGARMDLEVQDG